MLKIFKIEYKTTKQIILVLANIYLNLKQPNKAENLVTKVFVTCKIIFCKNYFETLNTKSTLSKTLFIQSRYCRYKDIGIYVNIVIKKLNYVLFDN